MFVPVTPDEGKGVEYIMIVMFQILHSSCHPIDKENHETWSTRIQSEQSREWSAKEIGYRHLLR